ncbi:NAD(P)/FAD-dependent oxidoreductase [Bryobacter aggregatus]|uniref:NAD(P)/FAD-dependent oxidoreductase n=1 Tax=Bryobacter aggregatus TaxID=360054 RepID=UPI0004E17ACE|nr:FAD-dependent oxidoreductase [Bryobacter aggregatus]
MIEIVGGGLIGLSCAWELGRRGIEAVVYERDPLGVGSASWAGAGMIAPHGEAFPDEEWRQIGVESARLYPGFVAAVGGNIDFRPASEGVDGQVDPRDLLRELSKQVRTVQRDVTSLAECNGEQVVVCAGAWASQLAMPVAVEPVKGYLLAWDHFPPGTLPDILRHGETYIFQRQHGRVIAGSNEERVGFDRQIDAAQVAAVLQRARALWPPLADKEPDAVWFGFRPATADGRPVIRRIDARVVAAYGHYRNGILLAPWTAAWVADEVQRQLTK